MSTETDKGLQTYLSFKLNEEVFAINVSMVINILEMSHITRIPKSPDYMKGVINLRGTVLPVVDMRIRFGLPEKEVTIDTSIIVLSIDLNSEPLRIGILVDSVMEVLELQADEIVPSPAIGSKYNSNFIEGMWRKDESFIMILDIEKVFSTDQIIDFNEHPEE
jgi:purine-binding chemotaxis protein CheW